MCQSGQSFVWPDVRRHGLQSFLGQMRVLVGCQHLLARWQGTNLFDLLILGKSSSVLLFLLAVEL